MAKIHPDLKKAILALPVKEKDKLLLRLVAKSELLIAQLEYQLLDGEADLPSRRRELSEAIRTGAMHNHGSAGWTMMAMRDINGRITHHVKVTKDKYGEVALTFQLLDDFMAHQWAYFKTYNSRSDTLALYTAKRMEFLLKKVVKLHEDYFVEFEDGINKLLQKVHEGCSGRYARELQLPRTWHPY